MGFRQLHPGEPAPWFVGRSADNPQFHFDTVAGKRIVLCLFGSAVHPVSAQTLECLRLSEGLFDDNDCWLMGVSVDPQDEQQGRVVPHPPRFHQFWDFDGQISTLYGALQTEPTQQYAPR
ncbi:MAG TPA: redoxin domain-containing protein, partial [Pirellulaceae bacterium]|nr:redoxin domain-containing protein [Pirellulaceae bacterium]